MCYKKNCVADCVVNFFVTKNACLSFYFFLPSYEVQMFATEGQQLMHTCLQHHPKILASK